MSGAPRSAARVGRTERESAQPSAAHAGPPPGAASLNVARWLRASAARAPADRAVLAPERRVWRALSFAELEQRSDALAHGLAEHGLARGMRCALFLRPGVELVVAVWALFKLGAPPVLIDPGVGARALAGAVGRAAPAALIGVPRAHALAALFPRAFASARLRVVHGRFPGARALDELERRGASRGTFALAEAAPDECAAVLFTSGSTGPAKGVVYAQRTFDAQVRALGAGYGFRPGEVDLACFPLFALFDAAFGVTTLFPRLDPARPARCEPELVLDAVRAHEPTSAFGSPAVWERVLPWLEARGERLPGLRRVITAGAPVAPRSVERLVARLDPEAEVFTPYGATEALPVTRIGSRELLGEARALAERGAGTCVGRAVEGCELALIAVDDAPLAELAPALRVPHGAVGEVCVRGGMVTRAYLHDEAATRAAKLGAGDALWHRMGDLGWLDGEQRLWLVGRKAHRIETRAGPLYPGSGEGVFDLHPAVRRSALVALGPRGDQRAALVVEPRAGRAPRGKRARDELARAIVAEGLARFSPPAALATPRVSEVVFSRALPVDPRHNAKIRRELLAARLARRRRRGESAS